MNSSNTNKTQKYGMPFKEVGRLLQKEPAEWISLLPSNDNQPPLGSGAKLSPQIMRALLVSLGVPFSAQILAFMNLKGGVGKTTSSITIATRAVQYGFKTCILDLDAQASATLAFGVELKESDSIFYDIWQSPHDEVAGAIVEIEEYLHILPSALENSLLDVSLINPVAQKKAVQGVCDVLRTLGFDVIIIDCPPSLGAAVISTACAADTITIPAGVDAYSFKGIELILDEIKSIRQTFGLGEVDIRILPTKLDRRQNLTQTALNKLTENYKDLLLPISIGASSSFSKALERCETIFASSQKNQAKTDYDLTTQILLGLNKLFK
ncbi:MAG: AAA family ATPase [Kiritimatiellae bacterium]|nr:AAA family ATPase [Kiritimatiellia bacterium]